MTLRSLSIDLSISKQSASTLQKSSNSDINYTAASDHVVY